MTTILLLPVFYLNSMPQIMDEGLVYSLIEMVISFITFYIAIYWILAKGYRKSKIIINHEEAL